METMRSGIAQKQDLRKDLGACRADTEVPKKARGTKTRKRQKNIARP